MSTITEIATVFDPTEHLFTGVSKHVTTLSEIGLDTSLGISSSAFSQPFRLFSEAAIEAMRAEVLSETVLKNNTFSSNINPQQVRGYGAEIAPFTFAAWKHPKTLKIISEAAGISLTPAMDYEIGHVNISTPGQSSAPVVDYHEDGYAFVCVVMLSDCTYMKGGETAIKTGKGDIIKVRGPSRGYACVLQGRYITHKALRAHGGQERITMVTSFRPRCPLVRDDTVLHSIRPVSNLQVLYYQFATYRLDIARKRIEHQQQQIKMKRGNKEKVNVTEMRKWLKEMEEFFQHTRQQIVEEHLVIPGLIT